MRDWGRIKERERERERERGTHSLTLSIPASLVETLVNPRFLISPATRLTLNSNIFPPDVEVASLVALALVMVAADWDWMIGLREEERETRVRWVVLVVVVDRKAEVGIRRRSMMVGKGFRALFYEWM
jgi:hypothetical protein